MAHDSEPRNHKSSVQFAIGVCFKDVSVKGAFSRHRSQETYATYPFNLFYGPWRYLAGHKRSVSLLRDVEGLVPCGETLLVLGRPGSGCSTLLRTLAAQHDSLRIDTSSRINYHGLSISDMADEFRGRIVYQSEIDVHFPHLKVRQTLDFAAAMRSPHDAQEARKPSIVESVAKELALEKALETKVGNDLIQGVSGGERKRTSIAEILVSDVWIQCWDQSTRGLDSATASKFIKSVCESTRERQAVTIVSLYQVSQDMFQAIDNVIVLYQGRQIYYGTTKAARLYFEELGYEKPERSTDADFLTSVTNPQKRRVRPGYRGAVPRTPDEFAMRWKQSAERASLVQRIAEYEKVHSLGDPIAAQYKTIQKMAKAFTQRQSSPYSLTLWSQVHLCLKRIIQRIHQDIGGLLGQISGNIVISLILGSMFYNMDQDTASIQTRTVLLFFGTILNSNIGAFEGTMLWEHRPIVEKHRRYGFYHPIAEAIASMIGDLPNKLVITVAVNAPYYFLSNLRRSAEAFFTYLLFSFFLILTGSMIWRADGAASRTLAGSMPLGAALSTLLMLYTGFIIPVPDMKPWLRWFAYINPCYYGFESMVINEFSGTEFTCSNYIPQGQDYDQNDSINRACTTVGSTRGSNIVNGDAFLEKSFQFSASHKWRNLGIMVAFICLFCALYLLATEYIQLQKSKGEILVFRQGLKSLMLRANDEESRVDPGLVSDDGDGNSTTDGTYVPERNEEKISPATFVWRGLGYSVPLKKSQKMILEDITGYIKPGTLTALIGQTGAGKTTLLNVLADRTGVGVVSGYIGLYSQHEKQRFASKIGYAQQQDLHLPTTTVRESLEFSAMLRQAEQYTEAERLAYVDTVIELLDMQPFAEAVIGEPGEGLNVEQRKRLTIGVELAARPELLIFLDEPTSGLDSDTAWSICTLLRKLTQQGHAILCTIHQPSVMILEMFDVLLVLAEGRQVYFGPIGRNSRTLTGYFENIGVHGVVRPCNSEENPAEWLLHLLDSHILDWPELWNRSQQKAHLIEEIDSSMSTFHTIFPPDIGKKPFGHLLARSFWTQLKVASSRALRHDWRSPSFLWSKTLTTFLVAFLNGVSVWHAENTIQGLQNQLFSLFVLFSIFAIHVQLITSRFIDLRMLYEVRERPSRTFSWPVFVLSSIIAELPSQSLMAVITFVSWYFPLGWHRIPEGSEHARGGMIFLFVWMYMLWAQTYSQMVGTFAPNTPVAIALTNTLYILSLLFSGLLVRPDALPRFWIFLYRASPISWYVSGMLSTALTTAHVSCAPTEFTVMDPPPGQTCGQYLSAFLASDLNAVLQNGDDKTSCLVCPLSGAETFLASYNIHYQNRWRDFGITLAYVFGNVVLALGFYWLARVPKGAKAAKR